MRTEPPWSSDYSAGLDVIKKTISERLECAGATLGAGCLTHSKISRVDAHPPAMLAITVVPFNGPRLGGVFTAREFLRSALSVDPQASAKVDHFVAEFLKFREDGVRRLRGAGFSPKAFAGS